MFVSSVVPPCGLVGKTPKFRRNKLSPSFALKMETGMFSKTFSPEDGGSIFFRNVDVYLQVHTALQPRRPTSILVE
jgi:hypothetical protein